MSILLKEKQNVNFIGVKLDMKDFLKVQEHLNYFFKFKQYILLISEIHMVCFIQYMSFSGTVGQ